MINTLIFIFISGIIISIGKQKDTLISVFFFILYSPVEPKPPFPLKVLCL